jgi:cysteinyl-tRNA synthetase
VTTNEKLLEILLNKPQTRAFLKKIKKIKKNNPKQLSKVFVNVNEVFQEIKDLYIEKSYFQIVIFDPKINDKYPWHSRDEDGLYLSAKHRVCKWRKAAEFETPKEARKHFAIWKNCSKYRMELIEFKRRIRATQKEIKNSKFLGEDFVSATPNLKAIDP